MQADAGDGAFAQADARLIARAVLSVLPREELNKERREVGIVTDDHHVFIGRALVQQALELLEGGVGRECGGDEDGGLIAGLGADELRGLKTALQRAGDDEIKVDVECVEDVGELEAVTLALLVERAFNVNDGIGAACAGTGVAKEKQIHAQSLVLSELGVGS